MKLGIFGATGNTGLAVVQVALKAGHEVTILVRNPNKLPEDVRSKVTTVIQGDVLNLDNVRKVVQGQDGIVVALGTGNNLDPTTVLSEGLKNALVVMKEFGVKRISACLSGFLFFEPDKLPPRFHDLTSEHQRMLDALKGSDREWTAVCPPHIADDPPTGQYVVTVGKTTGRRIAKEDLADFLISCLQKDDYLYQAVGLGYETQTTS